MRAYLRSEFEDYAHWKPSRNPPWAKPVVALRSVIYQIECPEKSEEKLRVAVTIAQLFGAHWTLPVAANLGALLPPPEEDIAVIQAFNAEVFTDDDRENSSFLKTKIVAYGDLPEVERFSKIMRSVYKDYCVTKLKRYIDEAETQLQRAVRFARKQRLEHQDSSLVSSISEAVKGRLDREAVMSQLLQDIVGKR